MDKVGTLRWDGAVAQARMDNLLSAYYSKDGVDVVLELAKRIRHSWPNIPVLLASGYAERLSSQHQGVERLRKPFGQRELMAAIAAAINPAST